jgi:hypothetical protein
MPESLLTLFLIRPALFPVARPPVLQSRVIPAALLVAPPQLPLPPFLSPAALIIIATAPFPILLVRPALHLIQLHRVPRAPVRRRPIARIAVPGVGQTGQRQHARKQDMPFHRPSG